MWRSASTPGIFTGVTAARPPALRQRLDLVRRQLAFHGEQLAAGRHHAARPADEVRQRGDSARQMTVSYRGTGLWSSILTCSASALARPRSAMACWTKRIFFSVPSTSVKCRAGSVSAGQRNSRQPRPAAHVHDPLALQERPGRQRIQDVQRHHRRRLPDPGQVDVLVPLGQQPQVTGEGGDQCLVRRDAQSGQPLHGAGLPL